SLIPAELLPIRVSGVQHLYAAEQIAFAKSVAVFSIGMPVTPPHPKAAAARTQPVRTVFVFMSAPGCNSRPSSGKAATSCDSAHGRRQRFVDCVQSLTGPWRKI